MNKTFVKLCGGIVSEKPKKRKKPYTIFVSKIGEVLFFKDGLHSNTDDDRVVILNQVFRNGKTKVIKL